MALRVGMEYLVAHVRNMIADTYKRAANDGCPLALDDDRVQRALDNRRYEARYDVVTPLRTVLPGGSVTYKEFQADYGYWGTTLILVDGGFATITPAVSDFVNGKFTFGTAPTRNIMALGTAYDVYGAAADLLEERAAWVSEDFDVSDVNRKYSRSQKHPMILRQANEYRRKQWIKTAIAHRSDMR